MITDAQYRIQNQVISLHHSFYLDRATTLKFHASFSDYLHYFDDEIIHDEIRYLETMIEPELYRTHFMHRYSGNSIRSKKVALTGETRLESDRKSVVWGRVGSRRGGAEDGIRYGHVTGVQTCALPIY